jgi:hypothetical protein
MREICGIVVEDEADVPHHRVRVELEGNLCRAVVWRERARSLCIAHEPFHVRTPCALKLGDPLLDGPLVHADLGVGRREEAAAGKPKWA